jgi:hypothetical protein
MPLTLFEPTGKQTKLTAYRRPVELAAELIVYDLVARALTNVIKFNKMYFIINSRRKNRFY